MLKNKNLIIIVLMILPFTIFSAFPDGSSNQESINFWNNLHSKAESEKLDNQTENSFIESQNTLDEKNATNYLNANNGKGVNCSDRVLLDKTKWTFLDKMEISVDNKAGADKSGKVFINFTCSVNDRVPGYRGGIVMMRLMRNDRVLTKRMVNLNQTREFYNDQSVAISFKDNPKSGNHNYQIQYKKLTKDFKAYADERNLQVLKITE